MRHDPLWRDPLRQVADLALGALIGLGFVCIALLLIGLL